MYAEKRSVFIATNQDLPKTTLVDKNLDFQSFMIRQCPATNYGLSQIGNMDKMPMCFGMPGARTTNKKGNKTVFVRATGHEWWYKATTHDDIQEKDTTERREVSKRRTDPLSPERLDGREWCYHVAWACMV